MPRKTPTGPHCPIDLLTDEYIYIFRLWKDFDDQGHEIGERINGYVQCPKCSMWWPNIEQPDSWSLSDTCVWYADGWWGGAECCECNLLMVDQPDGRGECYQL